MTKHSPLGFSGLSRYRRCPGSVALAQALPADARPPNPDWTKAGTACHEAWAWCLKTNADAWEAASQKWDDGYVLTAEDMVAGQF